MCELEHIAELGQNVGLTALSERAGDAGREVTAKQFRLETLERALHGVRLLQHVDAVRVRVDHALDRFDVTLDACEASRETVLLFHLRAPPAYKSNPPPVGGGVGPT